MSSARFHFLDNVKKAQILAKRHDVARSTMVNAEATKRQVRMATRFVNNKNPRRVPIKARIAGTAAVGAGGIYAQQHIRNNKQRGIGTGNSNGMFNN